MSVIVSSTTFTPTPIKISTITATASLNNMVDFDLFFENTPIIDYDRFEDEGITFIEYGKKNMDPKYKGFHKKLIQKRQKKSRFNNQMTIVLRQQNSTLNQRVDVNCKIFQNGNVQITGLKYIEQGLEILDRIKSIVPAFCLKHPNEIFISNYLIRLVNSDFRAGCEINRKKMCDLMNHTFDAQNILCSFEPCIYPGVKIQYNYNENKNGLCTCGMCKCDCKKIMIAVFQSGSIIITGGQTMDHIHQAYDFICTFLKNNEKHILR